jgi:hypothetical protein
MLVVSWLLARIVEHGSQPDSTAEGSMNARVANWLLDRKVESVGYMDSTIAGSMHANS